MSSRDYTKELISLEIARIYSENIVKDFDFKCKGLCNGCSFSNFYDHDSCVNSGHKIRVRVKNVLDVLLDRLDHDDIYKDLCDHFVDNKLAFNRLSEDFNLVSWLKDRAEQDLLLDMICYMYTLGDGDGGVSSTVATAASSPAVNDLVIDESSTSPDTVVFRTPSN